MYEVTSIFVSVKGTSELKNHVAINQVNIIYTNILSEVANLIEKIEKNIKVLLTAEKGNPLK